MQYRAMLQISALTKIKENESARVCAGGKMLVCCT